MSKKDFSWPIIDSKTEEAVIKQLYDSISIYDNSGIIGELEEKLSKYFDSKHTLLVNSGTSALFSMYMSANLNRGDEVICPAYTFFATVTPLLFTGAIPILADCDSNGNISPEEIKKKISKKTKAVVVTHMWGMPCDMDEIVKICRENNLLLFEDISHAFGATYKGKKVGTFGDAAACSLQGQKVLTGGEGGILMTNNDEMFYKSLLLGHYNKRCKNEIPKSNPNSKFSVTGMGLKLRIHPLAAAIASQQFEKISDILSKREEYALRIFESLKDFKDIEIIFPDKKRTSSWYAFVLKYKGEGPINQFYDKLHAEGLNDMDIPGSTAPLNLLPLFQDPGKLFPDYSGKFSYQAGDFPKAEEFFSEIIKMPVWCTEEEKEIVEKYISGIKKILNKNE